jgi:hypothetical protein
VPAGCRAEGCQFEAASPCRSTAALMPGPPPVPFRRPGTPSPPRRPCAVGRRPEAACAPQPASTSSTPCSSSCCSTSAPGLESIRPEEMTGWSAPGRVVRGGQPVPRDAQFLACGGVRHGTTTRAADIGDPAGARPLEVAADGVRRGVIRFRERSALAAGTAAAGPGGRPLRTRSPRALALTPTASAGWCRPDGP